MYASRGANNNVKIEPTRVEHESVDEIVGRFLEDKILKLLMDLMVIPLCRKY